MNIIVARQKRSTFGSKLLYLNKNLIKIKTDAFCKPTRLLGRFWWFSDIKGFIRRYLTKRIQHISECFPELDSCSVNPFKCELTDIPDEPYCLQKRFSHLAPMLKHAWYFKTSWVCRFLGCQKPRNLLKSRAWKQQKGCYFSQQRTCARKHFPQL